MGLIAISYSVWQFAKPQLGASVPVMSSARHIQIGEQHEPYNSDPPTSGPHYEQPARAGFYDEALPDEQLVHNLEHGYVIIWYNCTGLSDSECLALKTKIRSMMDNAQPIALNATKKLIAVPRLNMDTLISLTSWGRIDKMSSFNDREIAEFIDDHRNRAPEPGAP